MVSDEAADSLRGTGLLEKLDQVMPKCAIVSHMRGNRRYHDFVFDVRGQKILRAYRLRGQIVGRSLPKPKEEFIVYEECPECINDPDFDDGSGFKCAACRGTGEVIVVRRQ